MSGEAAAAGGEGGPARPARKVYVRHAAQTWARARELYLSGWTAARVAAEVGCSISAVRLQAARGGWTRRDAAAAGEGGPDLAGAAGSAAAAASPSLGEGRFDPPLLPASRPDGRPEHLRLTAPAWEVIRGERLAGASIAELSAKWKVSEGTIRRHAADEGWSNTDRGEAVSRAMVEAALAERAFAEGRAQAQAEALDAASPAGGAEADPVEAAEVLARRAAALALGGRAAEALALLKVAEGLRRASAASEADEGAADEDGPAPAWDISPAVARGRAAEAAYAEMGELRRAELDAGLARMARNFTAQDDPQYPELAERARAVERRLAALRAATLAAAAGEPGALPPEDDAPPG